MEEKFLQTLLEGFNKKGPHGEPIYHLLVICSRQNLLTELIIAVPEILCCYSASPHVIEEVIGHWPEDDEVLVMKLWRILSY